MCFFLVWLPAVLDGGCGGGGLEWWVLKKLLYGEGSTAYPFLLFTIFDRKGTPFVSLVKKFASLLSAVNAVSFKYE